jgi:hypothetical protein
MSDRVQEDGSLIKSVRLTQAYPCLTCDPVGGHRRLGSVGIWGTPSTAVADDYTGTGYPAHCPLHASNDEIARWNKTNVYSIEYRDMWAYMPGHDCHVTSDKLMPIVEDQIVRWVRLIHREAEREVLQEEAG